MYSIEASKLTKKFKEKVAVNEIDLHIKQGELFALLGTNGAGKTTTIKMLSGLIIPTSGKIKIENMDMDKDAFKIKEILNVSPQETAIAQNLTVKENLILIGDHPKALAWTLVIIGSLGTAYALYPFFKPAFPEFKKITWIKGWKFVGNIIRTFLFIFIFAALFLLYDAFIQQILEKILG